MPHAQGLRHSPGHVALLLVTRAGVWNAVVPELEGRSADMGESGGGLHELTKMIEKDE